MAAELDSGEGLAKLLGNVLLESSKTRKEVPTASLAGEGKVIGLYFSGQWCPPCKAFTPVLLAFYHAFKTSSERGELLDVVFISSDRNKESFHEYYSEMPWHAMPYECREKKAELTRKFRITGIPSLVLVDGQTGKVISTSGRNIVAADPEAKKFPWKPQTVEEILKRGDFMQGDGSLVKFSELSGKTVGLYFSAEWCPPCRSFAPVILRAYNILNDRKKKFEVIYVSSDHSMSQFLEYFEPLPFLGIGPDDERREMLGDRFSVNGIPRLVLFDENWKMISDDARMSLMADPDCEHFPWQYQLVNFLHEQFARYLNEESCVVYFTDGTKRQISNAENALEPCARAEVESARAADEPQKIHFFVGTIDSEVSRTIAQFIGLPSDRPAVTIIDCPLRTWYYYNGSLDARGMDLFVANYRAGKLDKHDIKQPTGSDSITPPR
ncbi:nucleoredoxin-like [Sycon ciliatum]|uniref:nucleoredoxin-like n=1 Tax=Sycon ciliatum TaxID=27933 RepID=UPI0020ADBD59|eukprot:scpid57899/ scgid15926/ Nucleoredoxin